MRLHARHTLATLALSGLLGACGADASECVTSEAGDGSVVLECSGEDPVLLRAADARAPGDGDAVALRATPGAAQGCASGGDLIEVGVDEDADGALSDDEVDASFEVCDGADGGDGSDGVDGVGVVAAAREEPAGANCPGGGVRVEVGLDADGDGALDPVEVDPDATVFRCAQFTPAYTLTTLSLGERHTCALTGAGGVKCWGENEWGQLGDGTRSSRGAPADVLGLTSGVAAVAAGRRHTCALTDAGGVKCWGSNFRAQLGSVAPDSSSPVDVVGLSARVVALTAGDDHSCALSDMGIVSCWGYNQSGQLGLGSTSTSEAPTELTRLGRGVESVVAGYRHTCALSQAGGVSCWGANYAGQLGVGSNADATSPRGVPGLESGVASIATGQRHTCALTDQGRVMCWGGSDSGQVGDGTTQGRDSPVEISNPGGPVDAIAAGDDHTCALLTTGSMKCWGSNLEGQLGIGTIERTLRPFNVAGLNAGVSSIALGGAHTCATLDAGGVKCWGSNEEGQLGLGHVLGARIMPADVVTD